MRARALVRARGPCQGRSLDTHTCQGPTRGLGLRARDPGPPGSKVRDPRHPGPPPPQVSGTGIRALRRGCGGVRPGPGPSITTPRPDPARRPQTFARARGPLQEPRRGQRPRPTPPRTRPPLPGQSDPRPERAAAFAFLGGRHQPPPRLPPNHHHHQGPACPACLIPGRRFGTAPMGSREFSVELTCSR